MVESMCLLFWKIFFSTNKQVGFVWWIKKGKVCKQKIMSFAQKLIGLQWIDVSNNQRSSKLEKWCSIIVVGGEWEKMFQWNCGVGAVWAARRKHPNEAPSSRHCSWFKNGIWRHSKLGNWYKSEVFQLKAFYC